MESIKLITDNIKFAKKRFVKPETVYRYYFIKPNCRNLL